MTPGRAINSFCWAITGLMCLAAAVIAGDGASGGTILAVVAIGLAACAYGAKIFLTRTSYWVVDYIYILPALGALVLYAMATS